MLCGVCHFQNPANVTACRSCGAPINPLCGSSSSVVLPVGTKLDAGRFTVGKVLGHGGFGITYLGGDTSLRRAVAVKEFFPQGCARHGSTVQPTGQITVATFRLARQKFLDEARVLAQFHHRGIVRVYSTFEENNTAYMVMELVKGKTLLSLVEACGHLPENEVVNYITQAADALNAVHEAKLLHRDIKPENLMVTQDGRVVLVDFGTARAFASGKTRRMTAMLTPGYAPLEQYGQQARFGVFTDLYALGATCYHLLTGQMPVQATDRAAGVELQSPHRWNHEVSQTVSDAVMWAMEMPAESRPQSVRHFVDALCGQFATNRGEDQAGAVSSSRVLCHSCAAIITNAYAHVDGHAYCPRCFKSAVRHDVGHDDADKHWRHVADALGIDVSPDSVIAPASMPGDQAKPHSSVRRIMGVALSHNETARLHLRGQRLLQHQHSQGYLQWNLVDAGTFLVTNQRILFVTSAPAGRLWERPLLHLRSARVECLGHGTGIEHDNDPVLVLEFFGWQETNGFYVGDTMTVNELPGRLQRLQVRLGASGCSLGR